jgi:PAS domain S-box-containing protein
MSILRAVIFSHEKILEPAWYNDKEVTMNVHALDTAEEFFRKVFMLSPGTVFICSLKDGVIIEVNENILSGFGFEPEEVKGKSLIELGVISVKDRQLLEEAIQRQQFFDDIEMTLVNKAGELRTCLVSGRQMKIGQEDYLIHSINDITARQRMEEELLTSRNLEAIGILAGGIAEDFNDLLTSILGNISMAKLSLHDVEKIHRALSRAEEITLEAAELAGKLLTFSEGGIPVSKENNVSIIIFDIIHHELKTPDLDIDFQKEVGLLPVLGDEAQLKNLFYNVLLNAVEAVPEGRKGIVSIHAENHLLNRNNDWGLQEGNYIKIIIEDNGIGIPPENQDKVFAPFFTTKDNVSRKGVGLGLSICQSIVKKHNGHIDIRSVLGESTAVTVYIPAYTKVTAPVSVNGYSYLKGIGRVLLMDDEQYVRDTTKKMLTQMGYRVDLVKEGIRAVETYKNEQKAGDPYDAVILNLSNKMGIGGEDTLAKLLTIDPAVKAIASSGFLKDSDFKTLIKKGFIDALKKPYSITRLSEVLNKVIADTPNKTKK